MHSSQFRRVRRESTQVMLSSTLSSATLYDLPLGASGAVSAKVFLVPLRGVSLEGLDGSETEESPSRLIDEDWRWGITKLVNLPSSRCLDDMAGD